MLSFFWHVTNISDTIFFWHMTDDLKKRVIIRFYRIGYDDKVILKKISEMYIFVLKSLRRPNSILKCGSK